MHFSLLKRSQSHSVVFKIDEPSCPFKNPVEYSKTPDPYSSDYLSHLKGKVNHLLGLRTPESVPRYTSNSKTFPQITLDMIKPMSVLAKDCNTLQYRFDQMEKITISESIQLPSKQEVTSDAHFFPGKEEWVIQFPQLYYQALASGSCIEDDAKHQSGHLEKAYLLINLNHDGTLKTPLHHLQTKPDFKSDDAIILRLEDSTGNVVSFEGMTDMATGDWFNWEVGRSALKQKRFRILKHMSDFRHEVVFEKTETAAIELRSAR
uniref:AlNc14C167G7903 protein n=1 Tax=Albugo laibachii Nc14 TaxID=890382 RepID=F0WN70_9STRA|nr:AlNc14C167G7903 [Albugo laibachii Nc14]|eukprot:CCA22759.1 AlNc14C167G7903 [Albugo laibachii Nc14]